MRPTEQTNKHQLAILLWLFVIVLLFSNCTYDRTLIYKTGYEVGSNNNLYFDGFYCSKSAKLTDQKNTEYIYPIFFYKDGSVILMGATKDTAQLRIQLFNPKSVWGYWGNYKINNDTISIETIASYGGSFRHTRNIKKGLIHNKNILFFQDLSSTGAFINSTQQLQFIPFNIKPDSTENWIRKKRKYN